MIQHKLLSGKTGLLCLIPALLFSCRKNVSTENEATTLMSTDASSAVVTMEYMIPQKSTDQAITTQLADHFVSVQEGVTRKNVLYVYLPGTYRNPSVCKATVRKAASMGYHAIGLMYDNSVAGNPLCRATGDTTCHSRARREVIDGIDRHPGVNVSPANSLRNRLYKLLTYLNINNTSQQWGQYILNGKPRWEKIIIAGHSQGGAVAGVIGKNYPVKKVIMFSMMDFLDNGLIPDWVASKTNKERFYALTHPLDELVPYAKVQTGWASMGMTGYGAIRDVGTTAFPYSYSHTLITTVEPTSTSIDKYHNCTGVDSYIPKDASGKYIYDKAWEYMINNEYVAENKLPVANAGPDVVIYVNTWINRVTLDGIASTDPDGTIVKYEWSKVSGPYAMLLVRNYYQTYAAKLVKGVYVFRLTVTDNRGGTDTDDMMVEMR